MGRMKGNIFMQCSEQILLSMKQVPMPMYMLIFFMSQSVITAIISPAPELCLIVVLYGNVYCLRSSSV